MLNTAQIMLDMSELPSKIKGKTMKHYLTYLLSHLLVETNIFTYNNEGGKSNHIQAASQS